MGVKGLNAFINKLTNNFKSTQITRLAAFSGKTIAFDFTNQLYRFIYRSAAANSYLLEFINLIHKFQKYNINLIFVFDGKPIDEKQYVIDHRKEYREKLIKKIEEITVNLTENSDSSDESTETIIHLTKKTNTIKTSYIIKCKELFDILGVSYIHVENVEADAIFRHLLDNNYADACFSGDMDVLAYGCHTILKDLDYRNDTVVHIDYNNLLNELQVSSDQFLYACILSGTDYNNSLKRSKFEINLELSRKYNTIDNIINNLTEINSTLPEEFHKSLPKRFDWKNTYEVFTELISLNAQDQIAECLGYSCFNRTFQNQCNQGNQGNQGNKNRQSMQIKKIKDYLYKAIQPYDKGNKYLKKVNEFVMWVHNINLCF